MPDPQPGSQGESSKDFNAPNHVAGEQEESPLDVIGGFYRQIAAERERTEQALSRATQAEQERDELREAIASALTSLATGPGKDGYAYAVLDEALSALAKDRP